ncbi:MAG TPA: RsmB/NOP family class I SAM-dependent RNA methyltransferase [candidate division Zixibacteria bacterium]|nr:RsmB/NOP family class I SAM-dependent RNA methyltransferase [candidate division Zixibacteria bacterium]
MLKEAWTLSIETLSWMEMRRLSEPLALARTVKQLGMTDHNVVRMAHLLVSETVRRKNFIDKFIGDVLKPNSLSEFDFGTQAFLRLYVYQTRIAKNWVRADFDEAANIVKLGRSILGWKTLQSVEPILGMLLTRGVASVFEGGSDEQQIGLRTFHPSWFVRYCLGLFGRGGTVELLQADMKLPPTYVRLNTLKADGEEILQRLCRDGVSVEKVNGLRYTYEVTATPQPVTRTPSFKEGLFYVQDKASCFAVEAGNPTSDMTVLDVCAAPGAKTTFIAQLMQNKGEIVSLDYSKRRMATWKNEVSHAGVVIAEPIVADARFRLPLDVEADLLVLDPPCTGTGTFAKNPAAKWRLAPSSIDKMAEIQWQMLNNCSEYVKPGGTLVYSTCSITVEENEMLVERFMKWHPEFLLTEITPRIGLPGLRGLDKCQRLYPHVHRCNGFFIAKMLKSSDVEGA